MTVSPDTKRPTPDALLKQIEAEERKSHRGKLKIFFGGCAGVGKTYAMLAAAQDLLKEGVDVVVGIVETHRRSETEKLLVGLPIMPPLEIEYRGVQLQELNLDAALERKPTLLLVDEFAHTNVPGMRHPKRWNDVEELLEAGIDVYTTLNVQHIESLSDLVAGATGTVVKETIPDSIFDAADDIMLVDLDIDELLKRLREGKVYIAERARARAADNFFKKGNLIALRELALRRTAERIDAQRDEYDYREGNRQRAPVSDKIMVCIGPDPLSAKLLRTAKRMATSFKAPWVAVYVENARHYKLNERGQRALRVLFRLTERIGGKVITLQGDRVAEEIIAYARTHHITKIIIGKPVKTPLWRKLVGTLSDTIVNRSGSMDVYIVTGEPDARYENVFEKNRLTKFKAGLYAWASLAIALATSIGMLLRDVINVSDQALIYLTGVVVVAARCGMGPAMMYAFLSALCLDFFFIDPLYSFSIYDRTYWTTLLVMVITGFVIAKQASRLRLQTILSRKRELNTQTLYSLTKELASTRERQHIAEVTVQHIAVMMNAEASVWQQKSNGQIAALIGVLSPDSMSKESAALLWCFDHEKPAGRGTDTMPVAAGLYVPLISAHNVLGVLGIVPKEPEHNFSTEENALLETIANLLAASLERVKATELAEHSIVEAEGERLRNTLLSSVSHDLRTPLASITGASSSIVMDLEKLTSATVRELARSIQHEASRLSRIVTNLLDITTFEAGGVHLNRQAYFIQEIIGSALARAESVLAGHTVQAEAVEDLPMVWVDGVLIEQVLQNLIENAAFYTPHDSKVEISATLKGGATLVSVSDNGPGIPDSEKEKIFDKFYTVARRGSRKGTGLGLAICASIVKAHGQNIWVENRLNGGAVFSFTLPLADKSKLEMPHDSGA